MAQTDFGTIVASAKSGTQLASDLNAWRDTVHSSHAGTSAPSYLVEGMIWYDSTGTDTHLKARGPSSQWFTMFNFDASDGVVRGMYSADGGAYIRGSATGSDKLFMYSGGSSTPRLVLDDNGIVVTGGQTSGEQIGPQTPDIQAVGVSTTTGLGAVRHSNDVFGPTVNLGKSRATVAGGGTIVQENDVLGRVIACGADGTDVVSQAARISFFCDGTPGANDMPGRISFDTTPDGGNTSTERARINKDGQLLINATTVPSAVATAAGNIKLFVTSDSGSTYGALWVDGDGGAGDKPFVVGDKNTAGTEVFTVYGDGDVEAAGTVTDASDRKLKTNIEELPSQWAAMRDLKLYNFQMKRDVEKLGDDAPIRLGVIAQDLEENEDLARLVTDRGTHKSVDYSGLYTMTVANVQELMTRVEALEARG